MNFLQVFTKRDLAKKEDYHISKYYNSDFKRIKDSAGMEIMLQLLQNTIEALENQDFLRYDIELLAEKAIQKIDIRAIVIRKKVSYQMVCSQFDEVLGIPELWEMLQDKFFKVPKNLNEALFRKVACLIWDCLKGLSVEEKTFINKVADNCISYRQDGRIEIIFPGELWGNDELVSQNMRRAENAGICFVEIPASPISKKAILPRGWKVADGIAEQGYTAILDTYNQMRAVFRIKYLPNAENNGEVDFFFDIPGLEQKSKKLIQSHKGMDTTERLRIGKKKNELMNL